MCPKGADGMANSVDPDQTAPLGAVWSSVDPDQTAPLGAVWSGSTLFAHNPSVQKLRNIMVIFKPFFHISRTSGAMATATTKMMLVERTA